MISRRLALVITLVLAALIPRLAATPALTAALDSPSLVWSTGGDVSWAAQTAITQDGTDAARATGLSTLDAESWIQTTVTGPGVLTWHWRLDLNDNQASALDLLVGTDPSPRVSLSANETWTPGTLVLDSAAAVTLRWRLRQTLETPAAAPETVADAAYLDTVAFAPFGPPVLTAETGTTSRGFTARWNTLANATDYAVEIATQADFSDVTSTGLVAAPATSLVITDLAPQTTYHYRLVAYGPDFITSTSAARSVTTSAIVRPVNDAFAAAGVLANASGTAAVTTLEATVQADEPLAHQGSVWFRWSAPAAGRYRFQTSASATGTPSLYLYTGATFETLEALAESTPGEDPGVVLLDFDATAGTTYRIALDAPSAGQSATTLSWQRLALFTPPANDAFSAPTAFSGNSGTLNATNLHATAETNEPAPAARTVWFRWVAPASGFLTLDTAGSAIPTTLKAFTGATLGALVSVGSDAASSPAASRVSFPVVSGTAYRVSIDGQDDGQGALRLNWSLAIPALAQSIEAAALPEVGIDSGPVFLDTFATATSGLPVAFTLLSGPATLEGDTLLPTGQPGTITVRASQAGDATYLPAPNLTLTLVVRAAPANDNLANSVRLTGSSGNVTADLRFATSEPADPFPASRSVWYRWTAPATGIWTLDTAGSSAPVVLSVLSGPALDELDLLASDLRPDNFARVQLPVASGTTYHIALDTLGAPASAARLAWTLAPPSLAQTITFDPLPDLGQDGGPFFPEATASSGLPVVLALVSGPATLEDGLVTLTGQPGTVTIRATQPGDAIHLPATAITVSFAVRPPPANDEPAAAIRLNGASGTASGPNIDASSGPADPFPAARSVWWRWTAPAIGIWTVDTAGSAIPAALSILSGSGPEDLELLASDAVAGARGRVSLPVAAGATYYIVLDTFDNLQGSLSFSWALAPPSVAQTITFDQELPDLVAGDAAPELFATASSGLPVALAVVSGPARLEEGVLVLTGRPGLVTLRATQPGDATHLAAPAVTRTFTVAALPKLKITLSNLAQTYDGSARVVSATSEPEPRLGDIVITYNGSLEPPVRAGTYAIVATADDSRATARLVVAKAPLTVTARDARKLAGQPNPAFALTYSGFLGTDDETALTRAPAVTSTAKASSPGGTYPIRAGGGIAPDYAPTYVPGILTVDTFAGRYEALLLDPETTLPAAKLELTVAKAGAPFTGRLTLSTEPAPLALKGTLALDADLDTATVAIRLVRGANTYDLAATLPLLGEFTATLTRNAALVGATASGRPVFVPAPKETLSHAGAHTLILAPAAEADPALVPAGHGHATAAIDAKGNLKLTGRLADATALTATLAPDLNGSYRLFALPYGKRLQSSLAGELVLLAHPDAVRFPGRRYVPATADTVLIWQKAASPARPLDRSYRDGFGPLAVPFTLDPWLPPAAAKKATRTAPATPAITLAQRLGLATAPTSAGALELDFGPLALDLGGRAGLLPASASLSPAGLLTAPDAGATAFTFKITPATGVFAGGFTLSDQVAAPPARPTTRKVAFTGVLRQRPGPGPLAPAATTVGAGHYLVPDLMSKTAAQASGAILLGAPSAAP